jgi:hypothetical protein
VTKVATRSPNGLNGEERLAIYTKTPLKEILWYVEPATSYLKGILEAILPHSQLGERKLCVSESIKSRISSQVVIVQFLHRFINNF